MVKYWKHFFWVWEDVQSHYFPWMIYWRYNKVERHGRTKNSRERKHAYWLRIQSKAATIWEQFFFLTNHWIWCKHLKKSIAFLHTEKRWEMKKKEPSTGMLAPQLSSHMVCVHFSECTLYFLVKIKLSQADFHYRERLFFRLSKKQITKMKR